MKIAKIVSLIVLFSILFGVTGLMSQTGQHGITVSWTETNNSDAAAGFNVFRGTSPGAESATPLNATLLPATTTSYFDSTVTGGTTYYYTVKAVDALGLSSAPSNETSATALASSPNPPGAAKAVPQ